MRTGNGFHAAENSMLPRPRSFPAPTPSTMIRLSNLLATMKAIREGIWAYRDLLVYDIPEEERKQKSGPGIASP
jgi:hypothetical protein